jgi:hypothetical protein
MKASQISHKIIEAEIWGSLDRLLPGSSHFTLGIIRRATWIQYRSPEKKERRARPSHISDSTGSRALAPGMGLSERKRALSRREFHHESISAASLGDAFLLAN